MNHLRGIHHQDWLDQAVCAQTDPDLFHPEKNDHGLEAKRICYTCPVIHDCLQWALDHRETHGIWGGTSRTDREIMGYTHGRSGSGAPVPVDENWHGTRSGARRHYREGSAVCQDCRTAYNAFERSYRLANRRKRHA